MERSDYYVYLWKTRLGKVVYVGKGCGNRSHQPRVVQGVLMRPDDYVISIVKGGLTEPAALRLERLLQNDYRVGVDNPERDDWQGQHDRSTRPWFDDAYDEDEISSTDDLEDCQF